MDDDFLRWLYDHAPIARHDVRKLIRASVGAREVDYRGLKWRCHPRDNSVERSLWLKQATEEEAEIDWLIGRLRPGTVFCDIGANCGVYAMTVRAASGAKVIAIEPNPTMRERLAANLALNGLDDVTIVAAAVGEGNGRLKLAMGSRWDFGQASLIDRPNSTGIEVDVRPLSDILREQGVARADAVKIDVEGFEDKALGGFLRDAPEGELPSSLVIEHLHSKIWATDLHALALSRGYALAERTANNFLFTR
jgi:FkbM family methyltransferase